MSEAAYSRALQALFASRRKGIDFGLERMRACLDSLALPAPSTVIQIAGTNGKGSTAQMLASVLRASGYSVGVFSSPHLLSICERFGLDDGPVSRERFLAAYEAVQPCAASLTFFEQVTALAAWIFADAGVDVAIYEVGLGGRLDSTTAIAANLTLVSGIGLDHEEFLGNSLQEIAAEKAGIFRAGVPALIGLSAPPTIRQLLADIARERQALPVLVDARHTREVPAMLGLIGAHQRANAALVIAACEALSAAGLNISRQSTRQGLACATVPGRFQQVGERLWIDGAHNAQAGEALAALLASETPSQRWVMVIGLSKEKRVAEFLRPLLPHCAALYATSAGNERAQAAETVAEAALALGAPNVEVVVDAGEALRQALKSFPEQPVLVTGSLLLLGEVMAGLGLGQADPIWTSDPSRPATGC